jgi:hypothetical protein
MRPGVHTGDVGHAAGKTMGHGEEGKIWEWLKTRIWNKV